MYNVCILYFVEMEVLQKIQFWEYLIYLSLFPDQGHRKSNMFYCSCTKIKKFSTSFIFRPFIMNLHIFFNLIKYYRRNTSFIITQALKNNFHNLCQLLHSWTQTRENMQTHKHCLWKFYWSGKL